MGREVRMVPASWEHPKYTKEDAPGPYAVGRYRPMLGASFAEACRQWEEEDLPEWIEGERLWREEGLTKSTYRGIRTIAQTVADAEEYRRPENPTYEWWAGERPKKPQIEDYMPDWPDAERTHFMMYEDTSEGTPISPAFATPEELARWLADNGASAFAGEMATYDQWLKTIIQGSAVSAVFSDGVMQSGVAFEGDH
ncbi:MAG: hypothetical protein E5V63_32185 [Mesorhizobium sp.]|nr:MAG: hypothetical protein E5V63_32185 [Mesorhizobium sp.]